MYNKYGYYHHMNLDLMDPAPFQLIDLGIEYRYKEKYDWNNRERADFGGYLFQYTISGKGYFETPDNCFSMEPGSAFLISFPDESRYYIRPDQEEQWELFFLHFKGAAAGEMVKEIWKNTGKVIQLTTDNTVATQFFEEYEALQRGKTYLRYESGEWIYHFLTLLLREVETPHTQGSCCVNEALSWMARNYVSQQNLSEMCSEIGVSLPHLTRQFHKEQGISPKSYLTNMRLEHAVMLLHNTTMGIDEIAQNSGFSCGNYFAKVFSAKYHMNPAKFRKVTSTYPLSERDIH